jgi:short-subunit dehydrogenase
VGFTHALRQELAETGIHATVVCPAGVLTDWAGSTEGAPMLPLLKESGPVVKRIARERHLPLPRIEGAQTADHVASCILEGIYRPVPEIYTHTGSREILLLAAGDRAAAEREQLAVVLGEREVYEKHRAGT